MGHNSLSSGVVKFTSINAAAAALNSLPHGVYRSGSVKIDVPRRSGEPLGVEGPTFGAVYSWDHGVWERLVRCVADHGLSPWHKELPLPLVHEGWAVTFAGAGGVSWPNTRSGIENAAKAADLHHE